MDASAALSVFSLAKRPSRLFRTAIGKLMRRHPSFSEEASKPAAPPRHLYTGPESASVVEPLRN